MRNKAGKSRLLSPLLVLLTSLILCGTQISAELLYPLGTDCFRFDYQRLYRSGVTAGDVRLLPSTGPFFFESVDRLSETDRPTSLRLFEINPVATDDRSEPGVQIDNPLRLFTISSEAVRVIRRQSPDDLPSIIGGFAYCPGQYFGAIAYFNLDRAKAVDPDYTGKKYRGLAGDLETAALTFKKNKISLMLGRSRIFWGPRPVNLLISETAQPLDLISAAYETKKLALNFLFARLDGSYPDEIDSLRFPDRSFNDNRYLVGHRLDIKLHHRFRVGLFETVLYGGEGRPPELYYLNPLQFFHGAQLNEDQDDNTILGFDFSMMPGRGTNIYGQLIVDDFQIDDQSVGDQEPNELGLMFGLFKAGKIASPMPDIRLEYIRLTNRTYHQRDPRNRYLYRHDLIGHPLGPDADSISFSARFWPDPLFFAEVELAYRRKGEGSIYRPWDEPWLLASGDYNEPFPTGVVEKASLVSVRLQGYPPLGRYIREHFFVSLTAGWGEIRNYLNVEGATETVARLDARISWLGFTDLAVD